MLELMQGKLFLLQISKVSTGSELDILLYLNNYDLIEPGRSCMNVQMDVDEALEHFRKGLRVL